MNNLNDNTSSTVFKDFYECRMTPEQQKEYDEGRRVMAIGLQRCALTLFYYAMCIRGDEMDMTGVGMRQIFIQNLEETLQVKVITQEQWKAFVEMK